MARFKNKRVENIAGDFYVDSSCIDCDTCRWVAPEIFHRAGEQSAVYHQPITAIQREKALQALLSCPTASIATVDKPQDIQQAQATFPIAIEDNVYYCGYHAESSYGAASYLIQHPQGNILVDSPRFAAPLVRRLEEIGGVRWIYLTHKDDVADHQKFQQHFQCERILHQDDITPATKEVEIQLSGSEPFSLTDEVLIIPVPGHSKGHTVLWYHGKFLFTGDHLAWDDDLHQLIAFDDFCWYSFPIQIESMKKLTRYEFQWVLPGHGRRHHTDEITMQQELVKCIQWMEGRK